MVPAAPCWLLIVMSNSPGMQGPPGVAVGAEVGVAAPPVPVAGDVGVDWEVATGVSLGSVTIDVFEPQPASTLTAARPTSVTSHRCIAQDGTCWMRFMRTLGARRKLLVSLQHRREQIALLRDALRDRR